MVRAPRFAVAAQFDPAHLFVRIPTAWPAGNSAHRQVNTLASV
jgi:hypothetical protein